ncbi:MAG: DUF4143 domain-containing protein [Pseudomonadota bacterium]
MRELQMNPKHLEQMIAKSSKKHLIIIDEIQKMPELLDEVHRNIELNKSLRFILTGSSARKLKKMGVNLLGGRATQVLFHPLSLNELTNYDGKNLNDFLLHGTLPHIVTSDEPRLDLKDYVQVYLQREVKEEALVKNFLNFSRFLDFASYTNTEILNFAALGSDAQIPPRTVQDYYSILEDTLLGKQLLPFTKTKRKAVSTSKFYFFDVGVSHYLNGISQLKRNSPAYGKALEHLIHNELRAYQSYHYAQDIELFFWRTHAGEEVDFILKDQNGITAIEVKSTATPRKRDLAGLQAFKQEQSQSNMVMLCNCSKSYVSDDILFLNMTEFVRALWKGDLSK